MLEKFGIKNKKAILWSEIVKWGLALLILVFLIVLALFAKNSVGDILGRINIL